MNDNHYRDFLPENRYRREQNDGSVFSPRALKKGLYVFYAVIFLVIVAIVLHFKGYDIIKVDGRNYNMNLSETIDLDAIYTSPNVEWVAVSDNVVVKNNVVTALKSGTAYLYAREDGKQVKDINVKVLTASEALSLAKHAFNLNMKGREKIKVNRNSLATGNTGSSFWDRLLRMMRDVFSIRRRRSSLGNGSLVDEDGNLIQTDDESWDNVDESEEDFDFEEDDFDFEEDDFDFDEDDFDFDEDDFDEEDFEFDEDFEFSDDIEEGFDEFDSFDSFDDQGSGGFDEFDSEVTESQEDSVVVQEEDFDFDLVFSSSNESVAKVDEDGTVEPVSPGTVEIEVKDDYGNTDHAVVTVKKDTIDLYNKEYLLNVDDTVDVEYNLFSDTYSENDVVWATSNDAVASVENGEISANDVGEAVITMTAGSIKAQINVKVYEDSNLPTDLSVPMETVTVGVGANYNVSAAVSPEDAVDKKLNWLSNNEIVALAANGVIIGKTPGSAVVSVTTVNGIKKDINVNVVSEKIQVESISLDNNRLDLKVGETKKFSYNVNPENASNKSIKIDYDKNIISVNSDGEVTGVKVGNTQLKITSDNGKVATLDIVVTTDVVKISALKLNNTNLELSKGDLGKLVAAVNPSNATERNLVWDSSNKNIVAVDMTGNLKAIGVGKATITVSAKDNASVKATCAVTVKEKIIKVTKVALNKTSVGMKVSTVTKLTATVSPNNASNKTVRWSSSDPKVVTVDNSGNLKAIAPGKAVVAVVSSSDSNVSAKASIVVQKLTGGELILKNAEAYYRKIEKSGNWVHRMDKGKYKKYDGWTECCKFTSHVLEVSGFLKKDGYLCHANVNNSSTPKNASHVKNMTIIKTKDMSKLKPGDVIIRNGKNHHNIAIFAYKKNGNYYVYGASSTNEIRLKSHPAARSWWKTYGITAIVRAK